LRAARLHDRAGTTGRGTAHLAVSVLNATATGIGCALAVEAASSATWTWTDGDFRATTPGADDRLARAAWQRLQRLRPGSGAEVEVSCPFPPSRGLKTSSSVAGSLVRAAFAAAGKDADWKVCASEAVATSRDAGVTLTGAFDDQVATLRGGCHVTDNAAQRVLRSIQAPHWHVAIWVPALQIPKAAVARIDPSPLRDSCRALAAGLTLESLPATLTQNGRLFHRLYATHGLPVDDRPATVALEAGALGAGLSGTGPAVAALFERRTELTAVPGGTWTWTRAAPEAA
jgi:shikimate kinase